MRPLLLCRQSLISLRSPTRQKPSTSVSGPVLCVVHAIYEECIFILLGLIPLARCFRSPRPDHTTPRTLFGQAKPLLSIAITIPSNASWVQRLRSSFRFQ